MSDIANAPPSSSILSLIPPNNQSAIWIFPPGVLLATLGVVRNGRRGKHCGFQLPLSGGLVVQLSRYLG